MAAKSKPNRIEIRVDDQMAEALAKLAVETEMPTSRFARKALRTALEAATTRPATATAAPTPTPPQIKTLTRATIAASFDEQPPPHIDVNLSKSSELAENENRIEIKLNDEDADKLSQMGRRVDEPSADLVVRAIRALLEGLVPNSGAVVKQKFDPRSVVLVDIPAGTNLDKLQEEADEDEVVYASADQIRRAEASARFEAENRAITGRRPPTTPTASAPTTSPRVEYSSAPGYYDPVIVLDDAGVPVPDPFAHAGPDPHLVAMAAEREAWDKLGANK